MAIKNFHPLLIVENIENLSNFLVEKFDFEVVFDSDWFKQLAHPAGQLGIMETNSMNQPDFLHPGFNGQGFVLTVEVEDADSRYADFDQDIVVHKLVTEEWGQRHFIIRAPENILIDVVNYTEPEDYT